jgi:WD40 repeat protein
MVLWDAVKGTKLAVLRPIDASAYLSVNSASFSPDGRRLVSAYDDGTIRVWDTSSGRESFVVRISTPDERNNPFSSNVMSVAFSPDGQRIVSASTDKTVRVWSVSRMVQIATLRGHESSVHSVAYSPDGRRIASASEDKTVRLWSASTGAQIAVLRGHENRVYSVAYSPDGQRIVSAASDRTVRIWDAGSGAPIAVLRGFDDGDVPNALIGQEGAVYSAAFSPDGRRIVTASNDGTIRVWDLSLQGQALIDAARARLPRQLTAVERDQEFLDRTPL